MVRTQTVFPAEAVTNQLWWWVNEKGNYKSPRLPVCLNMGCQLWCNVTLEKEDSHVTWISMSVPAEDLLTGGNNFPVKSLDSLFSDLFALSVCCPSQVCWRRKTFQETRLLVVPRTSLRPMSSSWREVGRGSYPSGKVVRFDLFSVGLGPVIGGRGGQVRLGMSAQRHVNLLQSIFPFNPITADQITM